MSGLKDGIYLLPGDDSGDPNAWPALDGTKGGIIEGCKHQNLVIVQVGKPVGMVPFAAAYIFSEGFTPGVPQSLDKWQWTLRDSTYKDWLVNFERVFKVSVADLLQPKLPSQEKPKMKLQLEDGWWEVPGDGKLADQAHRSVEIAGTLDIGGRYRYYARVEAGQVSCVLPVSSGVRGYETQGGKITKEIDIQSMDERVKLDSKTWAAYKTTVELALGIDIGKLLKKYEPAPASSGIGAALGLAALVAATLGLKSAAERRRQQQTQRKQQEQKC